MVTSRWRKTSPGASSPQGAGGRALLHMKLLRLHLVNVSSDSDIAAGSPIPARAAIEVSDQGYTCMYGP